MNEIIELSQEELKILWEEGLSNYCFHEADNLIDQYMYIKKDKKYYIIRMVNFKYFFVEKIKKQNYNSKKEDIKAKIKELQLQLDNADKNYK